MFEISEAGDQGTITVKGEITIVNAGEFRNALLNIQDRWSSLTVDLEGLEEIDVTGLQLLCSAHRSAVKLDKQLTLVGQTVETLNKSALKSGFVRERNCAAGGGQECLWVGRKK